MGSKGDLARHCRITGSDKNEVAELEMVKGSICLLNLGAGSGTSEK